MCLIAIMVLTARTNHILILPRIYVIYYYSWSQVRESKERPIGERKKQSTDVVLVGKATPVGKPLWFGKEKSFGVCVEPARS
jgi:hypothetical protein